MTIEIWMSDVSPSGDLQGDIALARASLELDEELFRLAANELADARFVELVGDDEITPTPLGVLAYVAMDGILVAVMRASEPHPWLYEGGMITEALETLVDRGYDRETVVQAFIDAGEDAVYQPCGEALDALVEALDLGTPDAA